MKKMRLFVLLFFVVCTISFSLDVSVGVIGGVGHSSYVGSDYKDFLESNNLENALKLNFCAGAFVTIGLMEVLAIQPEILLVGTGDKYKEYVEPFGFEGYVRYYDRLTYLEAVVLVKVRLGMFNLFAGPTLMRRFGTGKYGYKADDASIGDSGSLSYMDDHFAQNVFAATAGFGILYPFSSASLVVELRGQYCFQNLLNEDVSSTVFYQYAVWIMVGCSIPRFPKPSQLR